MILYSEFADGFQFSEDKKHFGIFFFVAEIFNKYRNYTFFMGHPLVLNLVSYQCETKSKIQKKYQNMLVNTSVKLQSWVHYVGWKIGHDEEEFGPEKVLR